MNVHLLSYTVVTDRVKARLGNEPGVTDADLLAEYAGRNCYQSWDKPNPETRTNAGYIANIKKQQHWSVLEHANITLEITGVSLALMWEITRHRMLSFSNRSTRYYEITEDDWALHPTLAEAVTIDDPDAHWIREAINTTRGSQHRIYKLVFEKLRRLGYTLKAAREAAAQFLPVMTSSTMVVSGNMRTWRHIISLRNSPKANREIHELMKLIIPILKAYAPHTFADVEP